MGARSVRSRIGYGGLLVIVVVALTAGVLLIVQGSQSHEPDAAPLPHAAFDVPADKLPPLDGDPSAAIADLAPGCHLTVQPAHVVIGSLCLNGPLVPVGSSPGGALDVPPDVHVIGLWDGGAALLGPDAAPLAGGTTLLAGHVNDYSQGNGVLYDLYKVSPGAVVYAADPAGHITRWRVTTQEAVSKAALPRAVFAGREGPRKLVLVTCGGPIIKVPGYGNTYRDNVVVTAIPA